MVDAYRRVSRDKYRKQRNQRMFDASVDSLDDELKYFDRSNSASRSAGSVSSKKKSAGKALIKSTHKKIKIKEKRSHSKSSK